VPVVNLWLLGAGSPWSFPTFLPAWRDHHSRITTL
jgi:hypothetical protein